MVIFVRSTKWYTVDALNGMRRHSAKQLSMHGETCVEQRISGDSTVPRYMKWYKTKFGGFMENSPGKTIHMVRFMKKRKTI